MADLKPPRKVKPHLKRRTAQQLANDRRKFLDWVTERGGIEVVERERREVAESFGSGDRLEVWKGKPFIPGRNLEREVPLKHLSIIGGAVSINVGLLLLPGGMARATVTLPRTFTRAFHISAHSTSTFARCGINIGEYHSDVLEQLRSAKLRRKMSIGVHNWSQIPVLIREGDPVRLLSSSELRASIGPPLATAPRSTHVHGNVKIHAGDTITLLNCEKLPTMQVRGTKVHFVDPHASNLHELFYTRKFDKLKLQPGAFVVISTKEKTEVPHGHVALIHSGRDDLIHSTAVLAHGGWHGTPALEFMALREGTIKPGDHVAYISTHPVQKPKRPYSGRYQKQEHPTPVKKK